jgi:4-oxalocrotonate tautomerase
MPVIIVEMWEGRSIDQKKLLAKDLTAAFVKQGVNPDAVHVILKDNPKCNWATAGKLCSEG